MAMDTEGKTQKDLFGDMRSEYDINRRIRNEGVRITTNTPDPVSVNVTVLPPIHDDSEQVPVAAVAKLNQQFFVWKNGEAGRLSVDTPFGFKGL
jgi:hypothetical protein